MSQKQTITKQKAAEMLYEINCYTNRSLSESFLWESDSENADFSETEIQSQWLRFLMFVQKFYPSVFDELLKGDYITTVVPARGYDTSVFAYFDALEGKAHWAQPGQQPAQNLARLPHTERDQYELIACYIAAHPAITTELTMFHDELLNASNGGFQTFITKLKSNNAFDTFWKQSVSFDMTKNPGCKRM